MKALLAALAALFMLVGSASGADDLIGGTLSAYTDRVTLLSQATTPCAVQMSVDGTFTLDPMAFTIKPGETVTLKVLGTGNGRVSATMHSMTVNTGDTASVTLNVAMPQPYVPPFPWGLVGGVTLVVLISLMVIRRVRPWQYRLTKGT